MNGLLGQVGFVVWRESVEALLIIAILDAWLAHDEKVTHRLEHARRYLAGGVLAGLVLAGLLGGLFLVFGEALADEGQEIFHTAMVFIAAGLILQMIFWMRKHARNLKRELENTAQRSLDKAGLAGVFVLVMVAVAREGAETVVFLYGILGGGGIEPWSAGLAAAAGLLCALFSYALIRLGGRCLSWRGFFQATEVMLLFLVASLTMAGFDHLASMGIIPIPGGPLWDSTFLIDDNSTWGGLFAALTGYRAKPDALNLIVYAGYWVAILLALRLNDAQTHKRLTPA
ncbi:MAG: FTR1 family protein [Rhodospirillales bacterium]|nr:FTR1 family protein [Rhodospirillales bacterium]